MAKKQSARGCKQVVRTWPAARSLLIVERLFAIVKPKLLKISWFAKLRQGFVFIRTVAWRSLKVGAAFILISVLGLGASIAAVAQPPFSLEMSRKSTLPKRLQPMLATLTDAPFDDPDWIFEDKYDGFRMVAEIRHGKVSLYSRNGKIISPSYIEVAKALEGVKGDAVIEGELVAIGEDGVSHFQLLQNALRQEAKLLYCAFDLMFAGGDDLRKLPLLERKRRLKAILPRNKLIAYSEHRKGAGKKFFAEAERKRLEGVMAKRADSAYASGSRTSDWLKVKTAQRQEVVIAGFTAPRRTRPLFGALVLAVREADAWRYIGHVGTGFSHKTLEELHGRMIKLKAAKSPFPAKVKDETVTTWVRPSLVAEVKFAEWTSKGELRQPVYLGLRSDKNARNVVRERKWLRK
jgi:bifunctional non-homologous end joining protein LigD